MLHSASNSGAAHISTFEFKSSKLCFDLVVFLEKAISGLQMIAAQWLVSLCCYYLTILKVACLEAMCFKLLMQNGDFVLHLTNRSLT